VDDLSGKKFAKGFIEPKNYLKSIVFSGNIVILALLIFGAYSTFQFFFGKPKANLQTSTIVVEKGATVGTIATKQEQENNKKSTGLEFEASSEDAGGYFVKYINDHSAIGIGAKYNWRNEEVYPAIKFRLDFP